MTRRVWGYVEYDEATIAVYYVQWAPDHKEHGANFDLIIGPWGDDVGLEHRVAVTLEHRVLETGPAFMVRDAADRPFSKNSELVGKALSRAEVIGQPFAETVFAICDIVCLKDGRISEIR